MKKTNNLGVTLIELLVAVGFIAIAMVALISLSTRSISTSTFNKEKEEANRYTMEAVEWLRKERDSGWISFIGRGNAAGRRWCLSNLSWSSGACAATATITNTSFVREATLTYNAATSANEIAAVVTTRWRDASGEHEVRVTSILTDWRVK